MDSDDQYFATMFLGSGMSYLEAARHLKQAEDTGLLKLAFPDPIHFLVGHAFELMLKARLRTLGETVDDLKGRGHNISKLWEAAMLSGLSDFPVDSKIELQLSRLNHEFGQPPFQYRYRSSGGSVSVNLDKLIEFGKQLHDHLWPICLEYDRQQSGQSTSPQKAHSPYRC